MEISFTSVNFIYKIKTCALFLEFFLNLLVLKGLYFFLIYLFLVALGLCCCARAFSICGERGLLFFVVRRLLPAVASLVVENRL